MEQEIFKAGVRPGGPSTQTEVKTLLCFILSKTEAPMSFLQLLDALGEMALVNYFELVGALDALCASGHLEKSAAAADGSDQFAITPLGRAGADELESTLPLSVREKALAAADTLLRRERRLREVEITTEPAPTGGYLMRLSIPEAGESLCSFTLFLPTQEEVAQVRRRFLNAPGYIYKGVLALLTGDREVLDEVFPAPKDQLF